MERQWKGSGKAVEWQWSGSGKAVMVCKGAEPEVEQRRLLPVDGQPPFDNRIDLARHGRQQVAGSGCNAGGKQRG